MSEEEIKHRAFLEQLGADEELSTEEKAEIGSYLEGVKEAELPEQLKRNIPHTPSKSKLLKEESKDEKDIRFLINDMSLAERLKVAMFGNSVCRALMITDPNKLICMAVLKNPKLQPPEIEEFSRNRNTPDMVLRAISDNRTWIKAYRIKLNLVLNSKTPPDVSLRLMRFLINNDLKRISKSKEVPQLVSVTAKKRLADKMKKSSR